MAGIDGLSAGDAVTAEQMKALFGAGMHPLAAKRLQQLGAADLTEAGVRAATQLGAPFKVYAGEVSQCRSRYRATCNGLIANTTWSAANNACTHGPRSVSIPIST